MKTNYDRDWLLTKAKAEDGCIISVGGLVSRVMAEINIDGEWREQYQKTGNADAVTEDIPEVVVP
ncbi:hypothetical protein [Methylomagnum sp.]